MWIRTKTSTPQHPLTLSDPRFTSSITQFQEKFLSPASSLSPSLYFSPPHLHLSSQPTRVTVGCLQFSKQWELLFHRLCKHWNIHTMFRQPPSTKIKLDYTRRTTAAHTRSIWLSPLAQGSRNQFGSAGQNQKTNKLFSWRCGNSLRKLPSLALVKLV